MSKRKHSAFVADIGRRGLITPLDVLGDGTVLDGRERLEAARGLGIEAVPVRVLNDAPICEQIAVLYTLAVHRRDLSKPQLAAMAAESPRFAELQREAEARRGGRPPRAGGKPAASVPLVSRRDEACELVGQEFGVCGRFVREADFIRRNDAELFAELKSGRIPSLAGAATGLRHRLAREAAEARGAGLATPEGAEITVGDFRAVLPGLPEQSVDLVFTDPDYRRQRLRDYASLAELAAVVLRPHGSLLAYCPNEHVGEVLSLMHPHLKYFRTLAICFDGPPYPMRNGVEVRWLPLLWLSRGKPWIGGSVKDTFSRKPPDKTLHDWKKPEPEAAYYIEKLCPPAGLVLDPFCGAGTTVVAALSVGRRAYGVEIDEKAAARARAHIKDQLSPPVGGRAEEAA